MTWLSQQYADIADSRMHLGQQREAPSLETLAANALGTLSRGNDVVWAWWLGGGGFIDLAVICCPNPRWGFALSNRADGSAVGLRRPAAKKPGEPWALYRRGHRVFSPARLSLPMTFWTERRSDGVDGQNTVRPDGGFQARWLLLVRVMVHPAASARRASCLRSRGIFTGLFLRISR